jgi:hypothetical protein
MDWGLQASEVERTTKGNKVSPHETPDRPLDFIGESAMTCLHIIDRRAPGWVPTDVCAPSVEIGWWEARRRGNLTHIILEIFVSQEELKYCVGHLMFQVVSIVGALLSGRNHRAEAYVHHRFE